MNKDDIDKIVGEVTDGGYNIEKYGSLLVNETYYWLATSSDTTVLWRIDGGRNDVYGSGYLYSYNISYGIRAKVTLVEGVWRTASLQQCKNLQGRHRADPYKREF